MYMKDHMLGYTICVMHTRKEAGLLWFYRCTCTAVSCIKVDTEELFHMPCSCRQLYITLHVNICMGRRQAYFDKHFGPIENDWIVSQA